MPSIPFIVAVVHGCQRFDIEYISETLPVFFSSRCQHTSDLYESIVSSDQFISTSPELVSALLRSLDVRILLNQFGHLNTLQETRRRRTSHSNSGVNGIGYENGNERVTKIETCHGFKTPKTLMLGPCGTCGIRCIHRRPKWRLAIYMQLTLHDLVTQTI